MPTPVISNIDNVNHTYKADGVDYAIDPTTHVYEKASDIAAKAPRVVTPVVSSSTASDFVNTKIVPTMNNAQSQLTASQQAAKDKAAADALASQNKAPATPAAPLTPEQEIMSQPDAGNQWVYDKATGEKTQVPLGSTVPTTHTTVDVKNAPAVDTTYSADGNITFKKLSDGSYGKYDSTSGQYIGMSNPTQFDLMKTGQTAKTAYDSAVTNGALLNDSQKAQIQSIKDTYARILDQQAKDNANFTGGTTVAQNLYGIGNTSIGTGEIKASIDSGAAKIADINSKMNSDVAKMTAAFQSENIADLKDAYTSYVTNSASLQKVIDTQHAEAAQMERDIRQQKQTAQDQFSDDARTLDKEISTAGGLSVSAQSAYDTARAAGDYNGMVKAAGDTLANASNPQLKEYAKYVRDAKQAGIPDSKIIPYINPSAKLDYVRYDANLKQKAITPGGDSGGSPSSGDASGGSRGVISADAQDVLEGRNTLFNIRQTMGKTNKAAAYMKNLRDQIRSKDSNFDFIASDAGGKSVSQQFVQKSKTAIDTVMPNIDTIVNLSNQLDRGDIKGVNALIQAGKVQIGDVTVTSLKQAQKLIGDELGVALGAGTMSDMKLQLGLDTVDPSLSPQAFAANMKQVKTFLQNRRSALDDLRYKSSTVGDGTTSVHPLVVDQTTHKGIKLPSSSTGGSTFQGITLPH